jgi:8-oxo-dGTP diphosphatase
LRSPTHAEGPPQVAPTVPRSALPQRSPLWKWLRHSALRVNPPMPLFTNLTGDKLLRLLDVPESEIGSFSPLTHALVLVQSGGKFLLVNNREKGHWELPGGMMDAGETARHCAVRETLEESGQRLADVRYRGLMEFELQPTRWVPRVRIEYGALYCADVPTLAPFAANDEIAQIGLWDIGTVPADTDLIDAGLLGYYVR